MHARVRRIRVSGDSSNWQFAEKTDQPAQQRVRLISMEGPLTILAIDIYAEERAARTVTSEMEGGDVESEEIWRVQLPLRLTDEAQRILEDPKRQLVRTQLTRALAKRLAPVIPAGFGEDLLLAWIAASIAWPFDDPSCSVENAIVASADSVLRRLEDEVTETLHIPWSPGDGWEVEIQGDQLRLGGGLGRIPLSELGL